MAKDYSTIAVLIAAKQMKAALREVEDLLCDLQSGGAENPEIDTVRLALDAAESAGI